MKSVIFLGKRKTPGTPKTRWPDADLWGTTHSFTKYQKKLGPIEGWDEWFDLHTFGPVKDRNGRIFYKGIKERRPATYQWYRSLAGPDSPHYKPLWLLENDPSIPAGKLFPLEDVRREFAIFDDEDQTTPGGWWTCQIDLQIAWAIMRGYDHLILHGHGVSQDVRHFCNHRGVLFWVGYCKGRGIKTTIVAPSWYRAPLKCYPVECGAMFPID